MAHVDLFNVVFGLLLTVGAVAWLRRLARLANEGEIYVVMSAPGDGLFGQVVRSEQPMLFWTVWAANVALIIGIVIAFIIVVVLT